jgi:two-component system, NtrC family, sensor kinase
VGVNFILYLLYGLAFFTLGVSILSRDIRLSELGIARIIWLLAAFGLVHGFHEWLELLEQLHPVIKTSFFSYFRLAVVSLSFLFLLYFGLFLNIITLYGDNALETTPRIVKILIGISALSLLLIAAYLDIGTENDLNTRLLIALPGGLLSGGGLVIYSRTVRAFSKKVAVNFIFAGSFMICYALLTGVIPSDFVVPLLEVKIIVFRGISAFLIMAFTIRGLSVFSLEQRELTNEHLLRFSQSEKLTSMGILAAGIAHEINNPLTNVSLNIEMLKDLVGDNEKVKKKLATIERNANRASHIASELLHFARDEKTELISVDMNRIVKSTRHLLKNQQLSSLITFDLQNVPKILGISWKLEEVFINLLMNSIDACTENDSIELATFQENGRVVVLITDTGHGITEENIPLIFNPFFTTKDVGKGTGLGLSVSYNIIKQHSGDISLVNNENGGVIVRVSFPGIDDER